MKLTQLKETDLSKGEHAVNFSEDLSNIPMAPDTEKMYLSVGSAAIKAGFIYKGEAARMLNFEYRGGDESIELTLVPKKGNVVLEIINMGEQKFSWQDLAVDEFIEHTSLDFERIIKELLHLMDALSGAQMFIGTSPSFEN